MKVWQWMTALALCVAGCRQATTMCPAGQIYSEEFRVCAGDCTDRNNENCWSRDGGFVPGRDGAADVVGDDGVADVANDVTIADVRDDRPDVIADVPDDVPSEDPSIEAPRPTFPCSLCDTTTRRPTFRWELPAMVSGAVLELCRDRACAMPIETVRVTAASAQPTMDLPASSVVFWRLRGTRGVTAGTRTSATWLLHTPAVSAPHATAGLPHVDVNGDGFDDIVLGAANATVGGQAQTGEVRVFHGGVGGPMVTPNTVLQGRVSGGRFGASVDNVGDVDGDGFGEIVVLSSVSGGLREPPVTSAQVYFGGEVGLDRAPAFTLNMAVTSGSGIESISGGDFNGDGRSDFVVSIVDGARLGGLVALVATNGRSEPLVRVISSGGSFAPRNGLYSAGDVNGDELADVAAAGLGEVLLGSRTQTLSGTMMVPASTIAAGGDFNGDGYFDVVSRTSSGMVVLLGGPAFDATRTLVSLQRPAEWESSLLALRGADYNADGRADLIIVGRRPSPATGREAALYLGTTELSVSPTSAPFVDADNNGLADTTRTVLSRLAPRSSAVLFCNPLATPSRLQFAGRCDVRAVTSTGITPTPIWRVDGVEANEQLASSSAD